MKKIIFNLLPAMFIWFDSCYVATAQDAPVALSDQITTDGQEVIQDDDSASGTFTPVIVDALSTSSVKLQFPNSLFSKPVIISALDGGTVSNNSATIDASGSLTFSFQVSAQPGVHRVIVIDPNAGEDNPNIIGLVRFEVPPATQ